MWSIEDKTTDGILVGNTSTDTWTYHEKANVVVGAKDGRIYLQDTSLDTSEIFNATLAEISVPSPLASIKEGVTTIKGYL